MVLIAFGNAGFREFVIIRYFAELRAHQLSTLVLIFLVAIYVWFVFPLLEIHNEYGAFLTGIFWVILTVMFEFTLGRMMNRSWASLFQQYDISSGRIWSIFILCLLCLPYLVYTIRI